jgi:hypothetical protein
MKISEKKLQHIENVAALSKFPSELLLGIYILETTYRKWYHRWAENTLTIISVLLNIITKRKVKNYTIGRCQIGLATILSISGSLRYRHSKKIDNLSINDLKIIIKGMSFKGSVYLCFVHLNKLYNTELLRGTNKDILIRRIGEEFNGRYIYGLLLEDLCESIVKKNIIQKKAAKLTLNF